MSGKRYTEESKKETVKQIVQEFSKQAKQQQEIKQLKAELKRVTQERDILKKVVKNNEFY